MSPYSILTAFLLLISIPAIADDDFNVTLLAKCSYQYSDKGASQSNQVKGTFNPVTLSTRGSSAYVFHWLCRHSLSLAKDANRVDSRVYTVILSYLGLEHTGGFNE